LRRTKILEAIFSFFFVLLAFRSVEFFFVSSENGFTMIVVDVCVDFSHRTYAVRPRRRVSDRMMMMM
jgi:hypothetical protein